MTENKPIIGIVRVANKTNGKIVTVPMNSGIEIGDYVAFKRIDSDVLKELIGV